MDTKAPDAGDSGVQQPLIGNYRAKDLASGLMQFFVGIGPTAVKNYYAIGLSLEMALAMAGVTGVVKFFFGLYEMRGKEWIERRVERFEQRYIGVGFTYGVLQAAIFFTFILIATTFIWDEAWLEVFTQTGKTFLVNFILGYPILLLTEWVGRQVNRHAAKITWIKEFSKALIGEFSG